MSYYYTIDCLQALLHSNYAIHFDKDINGIHSLVLLNHEQNDFSSSNLYFCLSVGAHSSEQQCIHDTRCAALRTY